MPDSGWLIDGALPEQGPRHLLADIGGCCLTGALAGLALSAPVVYAVRAPWHVVIVSALSMGGLAGAVGGGWTIYMRREEREKLLRLQAKQFRLQERVWTAESRYHVDIDQDGVQGDPHLVYVHGSKRAASALPASAPPVQENPVRTVSNDAKDFRYFLEQCWGPMGYTLEKWQNHVLPSGRVMKRAQWQAWRRRLFKAGLVRLSDPARPNSELVKRATLAEALEAFRDVL